MDQILESDIQQLIQGQAAKSKEQPPILIVAPPVEVSEMATAIQEPTNSGPNTAQGFAQNQQNIQIGSSNIANNQSNSQSNTFFPPGISLDQQLLSNLNSQLQ